MQSDKKPATVNSRKFNKEKVVNKNYKKNVSSDDDNDSESSSEEDEEMEEEEKFDINKYRSMLAEMFPSKYMNEKVKRMNENASAADASTVENSPKKRRRLNKAIVSESDDDEPVESSSSRAAAVKPIVITKKQQQEAKKQQAKQKQQPQDSNQKDTKKRSLRKNQAAAASQEKEKEKNNNSKRKLKKMVIESSDEEEDDEQEEHCDEEDDEDDSSYRPDESEEDDEQSEEDDEDQSEEDEEQSEDDEQPEENENEKKNYNIILTLENPLRRRNNPDEFIEEDEDMEEDDEENNEKKEEDEKEEDRYYDLEEYEAISSFKKMVSNLSEKEKKNKSIVRMIKKMNEREKNYNKGLEKHVLKLKKKNTQKLSDLMSDKTVMNDVKYFHEKLSIDEQYAVLKQMVEIRSHCTVEKPYRLTLLDADIPIGYKAIAYKKINTLKYMEQGGGEYYKIKNWVDTFMKIPFGKTNNLPITIDDGVEKCHEFMENASKILDEAVYGLDDVKLQIMQMVGQWISNPKAMGTAIAIKGPMGTGKTSLVKEGISKILGREFAFIALGGATDSSFLEGHSYTYEGSTWGKIVETLVRCKSMNPVFFFDELDKVSATAKGDEIIGILTHLTDTTQNSKFHDKYFSEIEFDLSKCLFIFSYNDESKINPILRDRMYRIETKGYDTKEKFIISKDYLLPKICSQVRFNKDDIVIPEDTIKYLINTHTDGEQGVRNLKRCLEIIYTKLNLYRLMKPGSNLFKKEMVNLDIKFPMVITVDIVDKLIKKNENDNWTHRVMYL
jgi:ATP-dependent Lon protease